MFCYYYIVKKYFCIIFELENVLILKYLLLKIFLLDYVVI